MWSVVQQPVPEYTLFFCWSPHMKTNKATQVALAGTGAVLASTGSDAGLNSVGATSAGDGQVTIWWGTHNWYCKEAAPGYSSYYPFPNYFKDKNGSVVIKGGLEDGTTYGPIYRPMDVSSCDENYQHTRPAFASPKHVGQIWSSRVLSLDPSFGTYSMAMH